MRSKKIWVVISFLIFIGILLNGCATIQGIFESSGDDTQFSFEIFNISMKDFDSIPMITTHTFDLCKSYKDRLFSYKIGDVNTGTETESELRRVFTTQLGFSSANARNIISNAKSVGNNVIYYEISDRSSDGENLMQIIYLERL